jgi:hypothetical protein
VDAVLFGASSLAQVGQHPLDLAPLADRPPRRLALLNVGDLDANVAQTYVEQIAVVRGSATRVSGRPEAV